MAEVVRNRQLHVYLRGAQLRMRVLSHMSSRILIAYKQTYFRLPLVTTESNGGEKQQPEIHLRSQTNIPVASLPSPVFTWTNNKCPPQRPPSPTPRVLSWVSWRWSHDLQASGAGEEIGAEKRTFLHPILPYSSEIVAPPQGCLRKTPNKWVWLAG